jgi:AcrR family transcriptional regulator
MYHTRTYGGVTGSDRRAARRERLLAAGLELLGGEGFGAVTVRAVCARARLTPRYFYESFADLDALLLAVFEMVGAEVAGAAVAAVTPPPGDAWTSAHAAISAGVHVLTDDPRKARVLFAEAFGSEALAQRRTTTLRGFATLVATQGRLFYGIEAESDSHLVETTALMLVGGLAETFNAWLDGSLGGSVEQLIDDCVDLFAATGEAAAALIRARRAVDRG